MLVELVGHVSGLAAAPDRHLGPAGGVHAGGGASDAALRHGGQEDQHAAAAPEQVADLVSYILGPPTLHPHTQQEEERPARGRCRRAEQVAAVTAPPQRPGAVAGALPPDSHLRAAVHAHRQPADQVAALQGQRPAPASLATADHARALAGRLQRGAAVIRRQRLSVLAQPKEREFRPISSWVEDSKNLECIRSNVNNACGKYGILSMFGTIS